MKSEKLDHYFYKLEHTANRLVEFKAIKSIVKECLIEVMLCCRDISNAISDEDFDSLCRQACEDYFREYSYFHEARNSLIDNLSKLILKYKEDEITDLHEYVCVVVYNCLDVCDTGKIRAGSIGFWAFSDIS